MYMRTLYLVGLLILGIFFTAHQEVHALTLSPVRFELAGDPGETVFGEMVLSNDRDTEQTYYFSSAGFEASGETGTPSFVEVTEGLATWITTDTSVTLAPKSSRVVPLSIEIPKTAEPGGNFAAIFWGTNPPVGENGSEITIGAKTTILVLLRVNGEISEEGGVVEFALDEDKPFYLALPVSFFYRFQNSGGDRIKPDGDLLIKNIFGGISARIPANKVEGNVLPASIRKFGIAWQSQHGDELPTNFDQYGFFEKVKYEWKNFAFGRYNAELSLTYGASKEISTAETTFWIFPWHLLLTIIILAFIIIFFGGKGIRSYNNWIITQAERRLAQDRNNA